MPFASEQFRNEAERKVWQKILYGVKNGETKFVIRQKELRQLVVRKLEAAGYAVREEKHTVKIF